jgi:tetratricopeptide (TPR) repeat protein
LAEATWNFPDICRLYRDLEEIARRANEAATVLNDGRMLARTETLFAKVAWGQGIVDETLTERLDRAEKLAVEYKNNDDLKGIWRLRMSVLRHKQLLADAKQLALKLVELGERSNDVKVVYHGAYHLSAIESALHNENEVAKWMDKAEACADELKASWAIYAVRYRRGANLVLQGKYLAAEELLLQSYDKDTRAGYTSHIAFRLAQVYANTGRAQLARQYAQEALTLFERMGMKREVEQVTELLDQLPR